jgi:hypothetical protein
LALAGSLPLAYIALGWCLCLLATWTHLKIALIYKHHYIYYTSTYVYIWLHMYFFRIRFTIIYNIQNIPES